MTIINIVLCKIGMKPIGFPRMEISDRDLYFTSFKSFIPPPSLCCNDQGFPKDVVLLTHCLWCSPEVACQIGYLAFVLTEVSTPFWCLQTCSPGHNLS